jgi:hypothetical protein
MKQSIRYTMVAVGVAALAATAPVAAFADDSPFGPTPDAASAATTVVGCAASRNPVSEPCIGLLQQGAAVIWQYISPPPAT